MAASARPRTYTEAATLALASGGAALVGLPDAMLRKVVAHLRSLGRPDVADDVLVRITPPKGRGAKLPELGQDKRYNAQSGRDVDFVRIPTSPIGVHRGGAVRAHYIEDRDKLGEWAEEHVGDRPFVVLVPETTDG